MKKSRLPHYKFCWHCSDRIWSERSILKFINGAMRKIHVRCKQLIEADAKDEGLFGYKFEDEGE